MKRTDLSVFLHFGESLGELKKAWTGMEWIEFYMLVLTPIDWLQRFIRETEGVPCPDSTSSAKRLLAILTEATKQPVNPKRAITSDEVAGVFHTTDEFLESFEREHRNLDVFTVTPKGIYDTRLLIDKTQGYLRYSLTYRQNRGEVSREHSQAFFSDNAVRLAASGTLFGF
jgi:hypothetical protein